MNKKVKKVLDRLQRENQTWTVTVLGDKENQEDACAILMNSQAFTSTDENVYHQITIRTLKAFLDAGIKFKTNKKWM